MRTSQSLGRLEGMAVFRVPAKCSMPKRRHSTCRFSREENGLDRSSSVNADSDAVSGIVTDAATIGRRWPGRLSIHSPADRLAASVARVPVRFTTTPAAGVAGGLPRARSLHPTKRFDWLQAEDLVVGVSVARGDRIVSGAENRVGPQYLIAAIQKTISGLTQSRSDRTTRTSIADGVNARTMRPGKAQHAIVRGSLVSGTGIGSQGAVVGTYDSDQLEIF